MTYSINDIIRYVSGNMSETEMYEIEKESLKDPFLAQALEGYQTANIDDLKKLSKKIDDLLNPENLAKKGFTASPKAIKNPDKKIVFLKSKIFRFVAGIAALLILVAGSLLYLNRSESEDKIVIAAVSDISRTRGASSDLANLFYSGRYDEFIKSALPLINDSLPIKTLENNCFDIFSSYIILNQPDKAENFIRHVPAKIKESCSMGFANAILLIKSKRDKEAKKILKNIIANCDYDIANPAKNVFNKLHN